MIRTIITAAALITTLSTASFAGEMRFHQAVSQPGVRDQVLEMLGEQPKWVGFVLEKGGVEGLPITLTLEDQNYEYYQTCRPHECNMKRIGMLIGADGSIYVRLFGTETKDQVFGNPPAAVEEALRAQG